MKGLRITKNVKETKFKGFGRESGSKKFPEVITHKTSETNSSYHAWEIAHNC